ncbi:tyrosine-type recombinase/integrase [Aliarcobacter butzleri]|uniref:tyrosine-type recombinase/integrase n=1 Tax=Aliarcobacter butzleri TaxID=28197 RepID=UPI002ED239B1
MLEKRINSLKQNDKIVFHSLRHTFASHLAINGTPIFTIQKLMNHKDIRMTLRYAKLSPDSRREAVINLGL